MSVDTSETSCADWIAQQDAGLAARGLTRPTETSAEDEAIFRELMGDAAVDEALAKESAARAAKYCPLRAQPIPGLRCTCRACTRAAKGGP